MSEPGGPEFLKRVLNRIRRRGPENPNSVRKEMVSVFRAVNRWANSHETEYFGEEGSPYLPESPKIPLDDGRILVKTGILRADRLFTRTQQEMVPKNETEYYEYVFSGSEKVALPKSFCEEGTFIVLLVPKYEDFHIKSEFFDIPSSEWPDVTERGNAGYDITVLRCVTKDKLLKLPSWEEVNFKEHYEKVNLEERTFTKSPLGKFRREEDGYYETASLQIAGESESIVIWQGDNTCIQRGRGSYEVSIDGLSQHIAQTINGTVCYRFVAGKPTTEKKEVGVRSLVPAPQTTRR